MDIRRIPLWESRNATYMQNDLIQSVIEDQGEVTLELSTRSRQGGLINSLSLPYFRGTGVGVYSDNNYEYWKSKQLIYQAGGIYFTFPQKGEEHITSSTSYWMVRRYGSEELYGGVWRLSELKSREENNNYLIKKLDLILPNHPVLYTMCEITNLQEEPLDSIAEVHAMLGAPFLETGNIIQTSSKKFTAFSPNLREVAINRFESGVTFNDLDKAPGKQGDSIDATKVPGPTGSYDYIMGQLLDNNDFDYITVTNPSIQATYCLLVPGKKLCEADPRLYPFTNVDFTMNYLGRMDSPWALYDGGTPQVYSLTIGAGVMNHHGAFDTKPSFTLMGKESRRFAYANALFNYDNPRMNGGYYSIEKGQDVLTLKRTKSTASFNINYSFSIISSLMERLINE